MDEQKNFLIPNHRKLEEEEVTKLLEKCQINSTSKLPKIKVKDEGISHIEDVQIGDVIEITRKSFAGETKYYRVVIE